MRKRPLCFLCIALIGLNLLILASGDRFKSPDVFLFPEQNPDPQVVICGEIYQCEYSKERLILYLKQTILSDKSQILNKSIKLNRVKIFCKQGMNELFPGDRVQVTGGLKEIQGASNPGQFDSLSYYAGKKISYTMWEPEIAIVKRPTVSFVRFLHKVKEHFSNILEQCIDGETGNIMRGIVLGDKTDISSDTKELYQIGGISHILAISAMHLTILGNGFYSILKKMRVPIRIGGCLSGVFLIGYGVLTGSGIATIRALIMFLLNIGAQLFGRTYDGITSLAIAAVLLLAGNPISIQESGFLLSFSAMVSFSLFHEKRKMGSSILLYFFMLPVMLWFFYEVPLYSVLVNWLVVPTLCIVLVSGIAVCLIGSINVFLGELASFPGVVLLHIYGYLCESAKQMPFAQLVLGRPSWAGMIIYYGIMLLTLWLFRKYRLKWQRFCLFLLMIPAIAALVFHRGYDLKITMLDVGQGECIIIKTPADQVYMVDGGSTSEDQVGAYRILPYLKYHGVVKLKAIFVTHPDEDHINGIMEILEGIRDDKISLKVECLILPDWDDMSLFAEMIQLAESLDIAVNKISAGGCVADEEVKFCCLYPSGGDYCDNPNEGSLVMDVTYKGFRALLTGDLEGSGELEIQNKLKDVDLLKTPHHGSRNSSYEEFLAAAQPEISIISCGENNFYGHPHVELLKRLKKVGSDIYITKEHGAIWVTTDGEKIDLHTFKKYN